MINGIRKEGWAKASRKLRRFHYFIEDISLCGKRVYQGWLVDIIEDERCCKACLKKLEKNRVT